MMKKLLKITTFLLLSTICNAQNGKNEILLKSRKFTPKESVELKIESSEVNADFVYRLIQFNEIPVQSKKDLFASNGVKLLEYIPNNAFIARVRINVKANFLLNNGVRSIVKLTKDDKISPLLKRNKLPSWVEDANYVKIKVSSYQKEGLPLIKKLINELEGASITSVVNEINSLNVRILKSDIDRIASNSFVSWVEPCNSPDIKDDTKGRSLHRSNAINTAYSTGRKYDGTGVNVALADDGFIGPHIDYEGRLSQTYMTNNGSHGDMTAGIMFGAGNINPSIRGMASGAIMKYYNITGYLHVYNAISNYSIEGTVVTSTSYSEGQGGVYTSNTRYIDQQIHNNPELIHVFSAGNAGTSNHGYGGGSGIQYWGNITGGYKAGKSVITSGNLNSTDVLELSSSRGPADDGRIKPDLCANGIGQLSTDDPNSYQVGGGTSAAAPGIAGVVTQLYQCYKDNNGGVNPESGLIKASLLNTAEDLGNSGPDFKHGWGRINGLKAARLIEQNRYLSSTISQGGSNTHNIAVPPNVDQIKVMVYWMDEEGSTFASKALVNDINMQVVTPSSTTYNPWVLDPTANATNLNTPAIRGVDDLNNMEQVTLDAPASGIYTVNLTGFAIPQGPQKYYLLYDFIYAGPELTYPIGGEGFVPNEVEVLRWDAFGTTQNFTLEYSTDNGATWLSIGTASASRRYYNWTVPNILSSDVKVRITRNSLVSESNTIFSIVRVPVNLTVDYVCPDTVSLSWNTVSGVAEYEVSMLGNKYMDSVGTSTAGSIQLPNVNPFVDHWFSVRSIGGALSGRRAIAIYESAGLKNCVLPTDVANVEMLSPQKGTISSCRDLSSTDVSVKVANVGLNNASGFQVYYQVNGGAIINENFVGSIIPSNSFNFIFATKLDLSIPGTYQIKTWVNWVSDQNNYNDTLTETVYVSNTSNVVSFPYYDDFESFSNCGTSSNCGSTVCNLGNGWINTTNSVGDDIDWRTDAGGTPSNNTGPSTDYTPGTSSGKYLYLEASTCYSKVAELLSPCIDLVGVPYAKAEFAYHMYGGDIGELHVDIVTPDSLVEDVIPVLVGDMGNVWNTAYIDLSNFVGDTINIRFRGVTGDSYESDIAIDAFSIDAPPAPTANFSFPVDLYCVNEVITFINTTIEAIDSIYWDFGAGATPANSTLEGPHSVSYATAGSKTVELFVRSTTGTDVTTQNIDVEGKPVANYTISYGGDTTYFTDSSIGTVSTWLWDFGNGVLSISKNPWHRYNAPGDYYITLIVTGDCGKDTIVQQITVLPDGIERKLISEVVISPNPSAGIFNLNLVNYQKNVKINVSVVDIVGKTIYKEGGNTNKSSLKIDISDHAAGTYFIKIYASDNVITKKIIKE